MVTKLKSIRYSTATKAAAIILAWISFISIWVTSVYLLDNKLFLVDSYFKFQRFESEYSFLLYNTAELHIELKSEENIKASGENEKDIKDKLNRYYYLKNKIPRYVNYLYYIRDIKTGEVVGTNIKSEESLELIKKQKTMVYFAQGNENDKMWYYAIDTIGILKDTTYEMYAAVIEPLKEGDVFYDEYVSYTKSKARVNLVIILLIASIVVLLLNLVYLIYAAGKKADKKEIDLKWWDIFLDIHTLLVFIVAIPSILHMKDNFSDIFPEEFSILSIDFFIGLNYLLSLVRQLKAKSVKKNLFIKKTYHKLSTFVRLMFEGRIFRPWIIILLGVYNGINSILLTLLYLAIIHDDGKVALFILIPFIIFNAISLYLIAKSLKDLPEIMEAAKQMAEGNLDYKLDTKNMAVTFYAFAENIQSIQTGLKKAVEDAIKGERMKTDLITNVSHDLKTPLTSIINYVDLLKKEPIENQKAQEYINILDEKSARMKVLIEDLIEASKASSGNLPVNIEKLDLCELVMQAVGEYRDKFESSGLDIRPNTIEKNIFVRADGKHMWRIIENLLSNVLKYSMKNSRVYINITKNEDYGILTIKNISELPLEVPVEQLTERFVRGDLSRTTEGSGLGLSIAQSLTNIQKGNFKIEIDGDLFKATVEIPLWK